MSRPDRSATSPPVSNPAATSPRPLPSVPPPRQSVNNAGVLADDIERTPDRVDLNFAVDVAAPYRLTLGLLPLLEAAPAARVVMVKGGMPFGALDESRLNSPEGFAPMSADTNSIRALEAVSLALAERLSPRGVYVNVVNPGLKQTTL